MRAAVLGTNDRKSKRLSRIKFPPGIVAEMTPAFRGLVDSLIDQLRTLTEQSRTLTVQIQVLSEKVENLSPRNSAMPPGFEPSLAKPKPDPGNKRKRCG